MKYNEEDLIWSQRYRPQTVEECILPESIKKIAQTYVDKKEIPNLLLANPSPGVGKTTLAMAMATEADYDYLVINSSLNANIDTLRYEVQQFASTVSLENKKKLIIWEEGDGLPAGTQAALRAFMEEFSGNLTHIITCNYKHKLIEPIISRCQSLEFSIPAAEKPKLASAFFKRVCKILDAEDITYDKSVVVELVTQKFPDFRQTLNVLQMYAATGSIDTGILSTLQETEFSKLIESLKNRQFNDMRKWLVDNSAIDSTVLYNMLYQQANKHLKPAGIPELILILAKYQAQVPFCANQEINTAACLTELMMLDTWA